jgi:uncharacterized membrane protein
MNLAIPMLRFARLLFALSLTAFGVLHFVYGDFVTRVVTNWPASLPLKPLWVYLTGTLLVVTGGAVVTARKPRTFLMILAGALVFSFLLLHLPAVFRDVFIGGAWTNGGKALVLLGGCFAVAATFREKSGTDLPRFAFLEGRRMFAVGRIALALFMITAGVQHFRWFEFVVGLVPTWVPGGGPFWTYASAVLLIAGGLGMLIPVTTRLAALLSGVMIFLWVFMLHLPRALNAVGNRANETTATFEALAFSGLAFLYAATASTAKTVVPK